MASLTIEQLIKIILGVFVVVAVIVGVFLFFKFNIIDFFKNLLGGEISLSPHEQAQVNQEIKIEEISPTRFCEDCKKNFFDKCSQEECFEISSGLRDFGMKCRFEKRKLANKCITLKI